MVGLVGASVQPAANQLAACGATRFLGVTGAGFAQARYATDAAAAEALAKAAGATLVLAPATSRWNRVLPGVAHRLGGRADTHLTGLSAEGGTLTVNRWYYRQRMEATLCRTQRPWLLAVEPGTAKAWTGAPGTASVEPVAVTLPDAAPRTTVVGTQSPPSDQQTIRPDATVVLVAGAGWTKKQPDGQTKVQEAGQLILGFLKAGRASLGSSKSLVDLGGEGALPQIKRHRGRVKHMGRTYSLPHGKKTPKRKACTCNE